jgi:hypothetical protein
MNYIIGSLVLNEENGRYGLKTKDGWVRDDFHCGETLEVLVCGEWVSTRIEMDDEWYLVGTQLKGRDVQYVTARIAKE